MMIVVYYSRTGNTKKVAETIADMLSCDIEEIIDTTKRSGPIGFIRSGYHAIRKTLTKIEELKADLSVYDLVIIGTPVWAQTVSTPVRTVIHQYKDSLAQVAFFSTHMGDDAQNAFAVMENICGKTPVDVLSIPSRNVKKGDYIEDVRKFVSDLRVNTG
jgi:flavodoxin